MKKHDKSQPKDKKIVRKDTKKPLDDKDLKKSSGGMNTEIFCQIFGLLRENSVVIVEEQMTKHDKLQPKNKRVVRKDSKKPLESKNLKKQSGGATQQMMDASMM